jgi:ABC-type transport system involved in cytochrome c biogenesis permease subunit
MHKRAAFLALLAVTSAVAAAISALASSSLAAFEPCRVLYRTHQPVQDSLACQAHSAIGLLSLLFLLGSFVLALFAGASWFGNRRRAHYQ